MEIGDILTVNLIGTGTMDDPLRPDITANGWEILSENGDGTVIIRITDV
jgi:hypothetical protein